MDICEPHRKHLFLYCCIYSAVHSNGNYPIVSCVFFAAGMCLQCRCPELGLHVTILSSRLHLSLPSSLFLLVFSSKSYIRSSSSLCVLQALLIESFLIYFLLYKRKMNPNRTCIFFRRYDKINHFKTKN
jgi:hypothetical protein